MKTEDLYSNVLVKVQSESDVENVYATLDLIVLRRKVVPGGASPLALVPRAAGGCVCNIQPYCMTTDGCKFHAILYWNSLHRNNLI